MLNSGAAISICQNNSSPSEIQSNNNGWGWKVQPVEEIGNILSPITTTYDYTKH